MKEFFLKFCYWSFGSYFPETLLDMATMLSHLDDCNSLLTGLPASSLVHPQSILNTARIALEITSQILSLFCSKAPLFPSHTEGRWEFLQWPTWPSTIWMPVFILTSTCSPLFLTPLCSSHTSLFLLPQHLLDPPIWILGSFILCRSQFYFFIVILMKQASWTFGIFHFSWKRIT